MDKNEQIKILFSNTINNLKITSFSNSSIENRIKLLELLGEDMVYLSEIDPITSVACEIMKTYIDCFIIIKKNELKKYQSTIDCNKLIQIEEVDFDFFFQIFFN